MAIAASVLSNRFSKSERLARAIDAFFGKTRPEKTTPKRDIEKDLIDLSPANQLRQTITQFKQQTKIQAELNIKVTFTAKQAQSSEMAETKLDKDLDLMLRMFSKDEKEYESLKARYEKLLNESQKNIATDIATENIEPSQQLSIADIENGQPMTLAQMIAVQERQQTLELDLKFKQKIDHEGRIGITLEEMGIKKVDPLVLDLSGEGINLTEAGKGANFDITADGKVDSTAWVRGNTALLVYDRNGNGKIDNGSELFGDQNGASDGFAELAKYDANGDRKINRLDPIFKALKLYRDLNGDGKIAANELSTLPELGIKALNLNFSQANETINGNALILNGSFEREDGTFGQLADVLLGYR